MQMDGVACLGKNKSPGRSARNSRKESPENVHSRRGLIKGREKWSFSECKNMVKMIPTEWARRNKEVGFGITSFGVRIKKI